MIEVQPKVKINTCQPDALTATFHGCSASDAIAMLGLQHLEWTQLNYGRYGYQKTLQFGSISILSEGHNPDMGVCLEVLGHGLAELVNLTHNPSIIYDILTNTNYKTHLTRIDIACDDFIGYLSMQTIHDKTDNKEVRTRLQSKTELKGLAGQEGHTIYFGSRKSDCMIRIYDKRAEQQADSHWIRAEIVLRGRQAELFQTLVYQRLDPASGNMDCQLAMLGKRVLADKLAFVERINDDNINRWPLCGWWADFLHDCIPIHLTEGGKGIPQLDSMTEWLRIQVAPTLAMVISLIGSGYLDSLLGYGCEKIDITKAQALTQQMQAHGLMPAFDMGQNSLALFQEIMSDIAARNSNRSNAKS